MLTPYEEFYRGVSLKKLIDEMDQLFTEKVNPDDLTRDYTKVIPLIEFQKTV